MVQGAPVAQVSQAVQVVQAVQAVQDCKISRLRSLPIVHTRARLARLYRGILPPPPPSSESCPASQKLPKILQTKISKIDCTFLVGYRTSFPHTLYYYYCCCYYYYYSCARPFFPFAPSHSRFSAYILLLIMLLLLLLLPPLLLLCSCCCYYTHRY